MAPANFSFQDWQDRTDTAIYEVPELNRRNLPSPVDLYRPGHLTWGKDVDRGLAIQRARGRKAAERNRAFFLSHVLPLIAGELNAAGWRDLADQLNDPEFYRRGGFVRYSLGNRATWIHPAEEPEKIARAIEMGASPDTRAA